jgi:hypothetical protein
MLDAYYQCYKEKESLNYVLKNFRKHYQNSTITLVCDGGLNFEEEAKLYNCIYTHENHIPSVKSQQYDNISYLFQWMERFFTNIEKLKNKYFILLEDDVFIMKKTNLENLKYTINGCNKNQFFPNNVTQYLKSFNNNLKLNDNLYYGACGGSILETEFFQNLPYKDSKVLMQEVCNYCSMTPNNFWAVDAFISYLCYKDGGAIGNYDGFCETWHDNYQTRLNMQDIEVLHKYKIFYKD